MKFLAITLLAACLIQDNHAQVGGPRDLSAGAQSLLDSISGLSVEDILNATSRLDASQLLELIQGAQGNVTTEISDVMDRLFMIISNVKESAMEIVEGALEGSGVSLDDVRTILDEAVDAGVISDCAAKTTDELGVSSAFKCVGDLLNTTITLTANISHVSARAFNLSAEYAFNDTTCSAEKNPEEKRTCQFNLIRAVAVRSIMLVKELARYANQVTILSNTLQSSLGSCVALARALTEPLRNVKAALKIISCLSGKIAN